jgi:Zn-dependent protease with chaperone function
MSASRAAVIGAGSASALSWCALVGPIAGADPTLLIEFGAGGVVAIWAGLLWREVWKARSLARRLSLESADAVIAGVHCRVVGHEAHEAFVMGAWQPTIYVGAGFLAILDPAERRGVLLHEEHHRRTRAPLRAAALDSWLRLVRPVRVLERVLTERIVDLEVSADAFAMAAGTPPDVLASALLKGQPGALAGTGYSQASERRISALIWAARGRPPAKGRLPLEWLPLPIVTVAVAACHIGLVVGLS